MGCNKCGKCCKAIRLPISYEEFKKGCGSHEYLAEKHFYTDYEFVYLFWKPISMEEAIEINPYLKTWPEYENGYYYKCTKLDENTNLCSIHKDRPRVCSDFPWYGREPFEEDKWHLYSESCGYMKEIIPKGETNNGCSRSEHSNTTKEAPRRKLGSRSDNSK